MTDENKEQTQDSPSVAEQIESFESMPTAKEFATLDTEVKRGLMRRFAPSEDDESEDKPENSDNNNDDSKSDADSKDDKSDEQSDDNDDSEDADDEDDKSSDKNQDDDESKDDEDDADSSKSDSDKSDKQKKKKDSTRELQAEFTRRSQQLRKLERENKNLKNEISEIRDLLKQSKPDQDSDAAASNLDAIRKVAEDNPKLKPLLEPIVKEMERLNKKAVERDEEKKKKQREDADDVADKNLDVFRSNVDEFLNGPLAALEPEFDAIVAEKFDSVEKLEEAAEKDPDLFDRIMGKFHRVHAKAIAKLTSKGKDSDEDDEDETESKKEKAKKRKKEVDKQGTSRKKSKSSVDASDPMNIKNFKNKTTAEKKALLKQHGAYGNDE